MWVEWTQCTGFPGTRERYRSCVHEVLEIAHEEPSSHSHSNDNDIPWCEGEEREVVHCFESRPSRVYEVN
ncbi:hypothetical protein DPMN_148220 [Dreissena polymorpha]|uniref:Uncharacterized protein n=2 Tax=Dreissena polymorpha TaxID=45954 RepID=A0A9D4FAF4_DREPO|nr:hypothetical protein DPMN_148220 [Dreissena polymorpha]